MRAISLTNSWLSGIQKGLQTGHSLVELSQLVKNYNSDHPQNLFDTWANDHKTLIVLDGGSHQDLWEFYDFLFMNRHEFDENLIFAHFAEDEESLNGAMTAVVMVLSDKYEAVLEKYRAREIDHRSGLFSEEELELFERLSSYRLAS